MNCIFKLFLFVFLHFKYCLNFFEYIYISFNQVILSHGQKPLTCPMPQGVEQAPPVSKVLEDGTLEFQDGKHAEAEVFMLCTGYNFVFSFLNEQIGVRVKEHLVYPLYKFLIPPAYPSLFIVGICRAICPFPHFHMQVSHIYSHCLLNPRKQS